MERALLVALATGVVVVGTSAAVLRPAVVRIGGAQPPELPAGVVVESWSGEASGRGRSGAAVIRRGRDLSRFQGRGPSGAK
ncbi:MAG: hypothetical protein ACK55X_04975 [Synechococcaceae cyanobacterium]|jgi:hypothetical protein